MPNRPEYKYYPDVTLFEYSQDVIGKGLYTNHYLTTERCYFYNKLFKCATLDVTTAMNAERGEIMQVIGA